MKLKSAHILAAASLATLMILAGCGTNNSRELTSPGYNVDQVNASVGPFAILSVQISPRSATSRVGSTTQLQANGGIANGQSADITNQVTWTSSDPNIASINSAGVVTSKLPGTVTIRATAGPVSDSIQFTVNPFIPRVFISNRLGNSIAVFDINANGSVSAVHKISGANTNLSGPDQMAVLGQELYVANPGKGEIEVFNLQADGNTAPVRHIKNATFTTAVSGIAINSNTNEIFALSNGAISVYDVGANGDNVTPKRTPISGPINTGLTALADVQLSLVGNSDILVPNNNSVLTFSQNATGDVAPTRTLLGPDVLNPPVFAGINNVANSNGNMFLADRLTAVPSVMRYPTGATANTLPDIRLTDNFTTPTGLLPVAASGNLWVVDAAKVSLYGPALTPASLVRSFTSTDLNGATGIVIAGSF
jgi:hypothetical protein